MIVAVVVGVVAALVAAYLHMFVLPKVKYRKFPGISPSSYLFGNVGIIGPAQMANVHRKMARECGKNHQLWIFNSRTIVITEPDDVSFLLLKRKLHKSDRAYFSFSKMVGDGLVTAPKERHPAQRRSISRLFNTDLLQRLHHHIESEIQIFVQVADRIATSGREVVVNRVFTDLAVDVLGRTLFNLSLNQQQSEGEPIFFITKEAMMAGAIGYMLWPLSQLLPTPEAQRKPIAKLKQICGEMLKKRRAMSAAEREALPLDLLEVLLSIDWATDDYIINELATFFFAGQDTTASALSSAVLVLGQRRDICDKIKAEVDAHVSEHQVIPEFDQVYRMPYLNMFWKEVLRVHPPGGLGTYRKADRDYVLPSGTFVPRGTDVVFPGAAIHLDPDHWPNPEEFRPERFSPEESNRRHPCAYMPFSVGNRNCIGQFFATHEALCVLAVLLKRYTIELVSSPKDMTDFGTVTLQPASEDGSERLRAKFHLR
mmetsp:Transcript_5936/g.17851  ORF Transcript_5936/g.17851 Transcript_5936/m.17851 type:complete len:484 (+) Transcript_5936:159-1610(+)